MDDEYSECELESNQHAFWIPVSKGLPKNKALVLVTIDGDVVSKAEYKGNNNWVLYGVTEDCGWNVIAWMPLPEPYKK